ncbi:GATA zinc finger domain-containing protein 14-like [Cucurbita pepo subsp. pepo]|uniref:GATA zinc finger domain-containing protein 14-like n=1 Tax=Cucurbita pepo subsp. pepo TaxID=3664 RepID=UPI000C9D2E75|nr:GATA zinc finger domain-containing protein 14-like [Cucurbita pepo subsp. pepo]
MAMAASITFKHLPFIFFILSSVQIEARVNKFFSKFIHTDRDVVLPVAFSPAPVSVPPEISPSLAPTLAPAPFFDESQNAYGLYGSDADDSEGSRTITDVEEEILAEDGEDEESHKSGYQTNLHSDNFESPKRSESNNDGNSGYRNSEYESNNVHRNSEFENNNEHRNSEYENNNEYRNSEHENNNEHRTSEDENNNEHRNSEYENNNEHKNSEYENNNEHRNSEYENNNEYRNSEYENNNNEYRNTEYKSDFENNGVRNYQYQSNVEGDGYRKRRYEPTEQQGMSDTRFMENGRYYHEINSGIGEENKSYGSKKYPNEFDSMEEYEKSEGFLP